MTSKTLRAWVRDTADDVRWAVRRWSDAHPPRQARLVSTVLTPDEVAVYLRSVEYRSVSDRASEDRSVAAWLMGRGESHRLPPAIREAVKIRLDPEAPE
ncbi:hypothetical protein [Tsukamurella spumae]|uniref:Uncharacterized protein n=1 Tax=Tsukamurella spumae TaxID=44753 RepID=A0A846X8G4_9ACTN|nr:hypothetical protein [Tsukamurella spumae]NKY20875.1 hypothetical protein [Tsukamurella spumae]